MSSKSQREKLVLLQDIDNAAADSIVPPKKRLRTFAAHKKQTRPSTGKTSSGRTGRKSTGVTKAMGRTAGKAAKKAATGTCKNTLVKGAPRGSEDAVELEKQNAALRLTAPLFLPHEVYKSEFKGLYMLL